MLKAKLDAARKNKKGFSLVELIIVMAIMVALIAVLAPQFVKYVQRARDSSVSDAAENVFEMVKSEVALGNLGFPNGTSTIVVTPDANKHIGVTATPANSGTITYKSQGDAGYEYGDWDGFVTYCGVDTTKTVNSTKSYTITVTIANGMPTFTMGETPAAQGG